MANVIFTSRLEGLEKEFSYDYDWYLQQNCITKEDVSLKEYLRECASDETKHMMLALRVECPKILVIYKTGEKSSYKILEGKCLNEIMETIKGKTATLFTNMSDLKGTIFNEDGTETDITYRFIKECEPVLLNRLLGKVERSEQYSSADLSRCSTTIKPEITRIFEQPVKKDDIDYLGGHNFDWMLD
jgi:hypothetical protein